MGVDRPVERDPAVRTDDPDALGTDGRAERDDGDPTARWYRSQLGIGIVLADVLLVAVLVSATTHVAHEIFGPIPDLAVGVVPWYVYVYSLLGALGYVFTALIEDLDRSVVDVLQYNFRLPAALPLGAGVYLLSDVILAEAGGAGPVTVGLVFLSGLYVNLTYRRLGALAKRLLPDDRTADRTTRTGSGE